MERTVSFTPRRFLPKIWQLGNFDVSPDGRRIAYSANKGDQWSVYVMDLGTRREKVLVRSQQSVTNPEFSPDGAWLAVQSDFEGDENYNVYVTPATGGKTRKVTDTRWDSSIPRWSPDGRHIAFLSNRDGDRDNLFVIDAAGGEATQLTDVDDIVGEFAWRPDGRALAFTAGVGLLDYIGLVDTGGRMEKIVSLPESENAIGGDVGRPQPWSSDGRELVFVSNVHDHLDLGIIDVQSRGIRWLAQSEWDKSMPIWSPDGKRIALLENRDGNIRLRTIGRDGRGGKAVSPATGSAHRPLWSADSKTLFYQHSNFLQPPRLIAWRGTASTRLIDSGRTASPKRELARGKLVWYPSFDGRKIPAWLFVPPKGRSRGAAIVDPHGGPESQTINEWRLGYQFYVAEGFTVLAPNYRGGTGYGRAWRRLSDRDLGGADMQDIIAGGRWLVENRYCRPDRLGIVGVSYGGYAVAHCLEQATDLWQVGVSIVGYFNWTTATTNERGYLRRYDRQKMGDPEKYADLHRKLSPIHYLGRIRVPVLFTGGAHDPRCPVTEARAMVESMKRMGKVVDYLEFPDEGHSPRKTANQILLYERVLDWLNRYLPDG